MFIKKDPDDDESNLIKNLIKNIVYMIYKNIGKK